MTVHPQQPDVGLTPAVELANRALTRRDHRRTRIAAYPALLAAHGVDPSPLDHTSFRQLPPMTKENYLLAHPRTDLIWDGSLGDVVNWSASSGSTGTPTYWPRSLHSLYDSVRFHEKILRDSFEAHKRSTLVVNTFAMGNWIGGTYTLMAINGTNDLDMPVSIISPGMEIDDAVPAFETLGPDYDQVVVAGYPGSVMDLLDHIDPESIAQQNVKILLAGEAISERWRTAMLKKIGKLDDARSITLIYGTADAGMMGFETPASIAIRRAAADDELLRSALFGSDLKRLPTFAWYDPASRYIETDQDGFLIFTVDSTLPLIRYRIKDYGTLFDSDRLRHILHACGYSHLAEPLAADDFFVTVSGRAGVEATVNGLNVYRANIQTALESTQVIQQVTSYFWVEAIEKDDLTKEFRINVELKDGRKPTEELRDIVTQALVDSLCEQNGEFRKQYSTDPAKSTPNVVLATYEGLSTKSLKHQMNRKPQ